MALFVFALALSLIWVLLAGLVAEFAEKKGHSSALWYVFSLVCSPLVGFLIVALLPSASDLAPAEYTWCRYCLRTVKAGTDACPYCHADLAEKAAAQKKAA
jgi:hypothetical protein